MNPFSLIKHALSHAKFEHDDTQPAVIRVLNEIEDERNNLVSETEMGIDLEKATKKLQVHLVELLRDEEESEENEAQVALAKSDNTKSIGDLEDSED